jgi:hypothetical protein
LLLSGDTRGLRAQWLDECRAVLRHDDHNLDDHDDVRV